MTQKQIYEAVCDLAYDAGASPEEYILGLIRARNDEALAETENLPENIRQRLASAEKARVEARDIKRRERDERSMRDDISKFRECFPDVSADDIPESVWNEAANGIPLANAYALYLSIASNGELKAAEANRYAEERAVPVGNDESEAPYTKEQVEGMDAASVKRNYKKILSSVKGWKF